MRHFGVTCEQGLFGPRFNAAPTQLLPCILDEAPERIQLLRWGLIPKWAKDPTIGYKMINARAETLAEKPAFRGLLRTRRCVALADSFFEWRREGKAKQPLRIMFSDGAPFAFAGLWDEWTAPDGTKVRSFTIVTTEANECVAPVHDRMPVIMREEEARRWLDRSIPAAEALALCRPRSGAEFEARAVSRRVNSPKNDDPSVLEEI